MRQLRINAKRIGEYVFERRPFLLPFVIVLVCGIPWWIAFWPGTLQYDSCGQLLQYLGVAPMTGHHPYPVTLLMGALLRVGRICFHSDNAGIFLYTGAQFIGQATTVAYSFCVLKRLGGIPLWVRGCCLFFYALFPLLPNWGISYGKDTGYYLFFLLLTVALLDIFFAAGREEKPSCRQWALWIAAVLGVVSFRNDGRYVILFTVLVLLLYRRRYWRISLAGLGIALGFLALVEQVYMPLKNIPLGSVREAMSVPLLQTAEYVKEYADEVTEEERAVLQQVFRAGDLTELADTYDSAISDPVKNLFLEYPTGQELGSYIRLWWGQLKKHPLSCIRTYWQHCSGYFIPGARAYDDLIGWFWMLDDQSRSDSYLDIFFRESAYEMRIAMEKWVCWLYEVPLAGLLYRPSTYTWVMLGCLAWMILKKKPWAFAVLPGVLVLMICTVSPLNGSVRYFLPLMAAAPIYLACCFGGKGQELV